MNIYASPKKKNLSKFTLSSISIIVGLTLPHFALSYTQGDTEIATVNAGDSVVKIDTLSEEENSSVITGKLNRSGNPVRIIWYGHPADDKGPADDDGEIPQTGAENNGFIQGGIKAEGIISAQGQGNAIDAFGWTPQTNKNDVVIIQDKINNQGTAIGGANLVSKETNNDAHIYAFSDANGASVTAIAKYGVDAFSGATDTSIALDSTVDTSSKEKAGYDEPKTVQVSLTNLNNTGILSGSLTTSSPTQIEPEKTIKDYHHNVSASGNGVSLATVLGSSDQSITPDDKTNQVSLENVNNSGTLFGAVTLQTSDFATNTSTFSRGSGNGLSLYALSGESVKHPTSTALNNLTNNGKISGYLQQTSGDNIGKVDKDYVGSLSYSDKDKVSSSAMSFGSGNGVSVFTETRNTNVTSNKSSLNKVDNAGRITGYADIQSGDGYLGDMRLYAMGVGNGIVSYANRYRNNQGLISFYQGEASLGDVHNQGIISGELHTKTGRYTLGGENDPAEEEVKLALASSLSVGSGILASTYLIVGDHLPTASNNTTKYSYNYRSTKSDTQIYASGSGIAVFENGTNTTKAGSTLGNIDNRGVISGYASMYHGFAANNNANSSYKAVDFLGAGVGVFTDSHISSTIKNTGIISGNHAAILGKGKTSNSSDTELNSGYTGSVQNYGLMAGTAIVGNFVPNPASKNYSQKAQSYLYFEKEQDPVFTNLGTLVYLKEGSTLEITPTPRYPFISRSETTRHADNETIDHIVIGQGGNYTDSETGKTYEIINGALSQDEKDSAYTATESELNNKIINGVGLADGALIAKSDLTLTDSVVNGFANGVKVKNESTFTANNSTINTNGFDIKLDADNNHYAPLAIVGDDANNKVNLSGSTIINGDIDLNAGDDSLTIASSALQMNGLTIDMNEGHDSVIFGESASTDNAPIRVNYDILNTEILVVNALTEFSPDMAITGVDTIDLNSKLVYQVNKLNDGHYQHALAHNGKNITINGSEDNAFYIDVNEAEHYIDFGENQIQDNGKVNYKSSNVMQAAEFKDGQLHVFVKPTTPETDDSDSDTPLDNDSDQTAGAAASNNADQNANTPSAGTTSSFTTPYTAAYNSLVESWNTSGVNPLKNSASILDKTEQEATAEINSYLNEVVNHNIYGAVPVAMLDSLRAYRNTTLQNGNLLKQGEVFAGLTGTAEQHTYDSVADKGNTSNAVVNVKYGVTDNLTAGMAFGAGHEKLSGQSGSALKGNSTYVAGQLTYGVDNLTMNTGVAYSQSNLKGQRHIHNHYDSHTFDVKVKPTAWTVYTQAKYAIPLGENVKIEPKVGIAYNQVTIDEINEQGVGALTVKKQRHNNLDLMAGQDFTVNHTLLSGDKLSAVFSVDYLHSTKQPTTQASFDGINYFDVSSEKDADAVRLGLSAQYKLLNGLGFNVGFGNSMRSSGNVWNANVGVNYTF
ncbi:autotransporter domain-containing protein [Lonepinella sp. BR2271]|uniref:autotransporter domain-containing protein n=1 Tax=Lonepinella sp. BR2271 TaxID=3434550 RepID=UPI003F6DBE37